VKIDIFVSFFVVVECVYIIIIVSVILVFTFQPVPPRYKFVHCSCRDARYDINCMDIGKSADVSIVSGTGSPGLSWIKGP